VARRVFFSFHFERDIWRVNQVRNSNVVAGYEKAGFFDHSEYQEVKQRGDAAIRRKIRQRLAGTTVTVVLIGSETAQRDWVRFEIDESIAQRNGFLGIYIHHLEDQGGNSSWSWWPPTKPFVPPGIDFPCYDWDEDVDKFRRAIEDAGRRADRWRAMDGVRAR